MLYQLIQYAQAQGLSGKPGYAKRRIRAIITIAANGNVQAETSDRMAYVPNLSDSELKGAGGIRSHFLADAMSIVLGMDKKPRRHNAFVALHAEAARHLPGLAPVVIALSDTAVLQTMQQRLSELKVKTTDVITFRLGGNDQLLVEQEFWQDWWDSHRATLQKPTTGVFMRCLATGELVEPALTHPLKLKLGSIGGNSQDISLICFDKSAFTSFGLKQSHNAACSKESAAVFVDALNYLIQNAPRPLSGTLLLHWFERSIPPEDDPFGLVDERDEDTERESARQAANRLAEAVHEGNRPGPQHNRYHVILLAPEKIGRAKVRSTFEGELRELYDNFKLWFDDLSIVAPNGVSSAEPPKLYAVLMRLIRYRPNPKEEEKKKAMDDIAPLVVRIWDSILTASPFPQAAANMAMNNMRSRLLRAREDDREHGLENLDRIAISILKLWYNRAVRFGLLTKGGKNMEEKLNIDYPDPAYHAGRLLAVLNHLQHRAMPDVKADIVQRFYSSASVTPALVIGRLIDGAQPHLNKLRRNDEVGLAVWHEKQITEIMGKIGLPAPDQLDFTGQTLFALGYYHQLSALFEGNTKNDKEEKSNGTEESL